MSIQLQPIQYALQSPIPLLRLLQVLITATLHPPVL